MKVKIGLFFSVLLSYMLSLAVVPVFADEAGRVSEAVSVLKEITVIPEKGIHPLLFKDAAGIAVIPGVIKVGLGVGGRFGTGILVVRDKAGVWSSPVFVGIGGGSIGWQIGAQSTDFILVFKNRRSIDGIVNGKFTLGVDAAVAAGPVGRNFEANTDALMKAEIYSYSRSRGLFAGLSLEGAVLFIDHDADAAFYHRPNVSAGDILSGRIESDSPDVRRLRDILSTHVKGR